ncbi:hypothetical protein BLX41_17980 [Pseudomonas protegens]|nr:hypothetical protein BLX41_17980 [Pseudomonas protegens]
MGFGEEVAQGRAEGSGHRQQITCGFRVAAQIFMTQKARVIWGSLFIGKGAPRVAFEMACRGLQTCAKAERPGVKNRSGLNEKTVEGFFILFLSATCSINDQLMLDA